VWQVTWRITADVPLGIEEAWVPHGRFRGRERLRFQPPLAVPTDLQLAVLADEAPGTVVENAFLILRVTGGWRVFVRMRVDFDSVRPRPTCEVVTLQSADAPD
jgi:hypothetical protein